MHIIIYPGFKSFEAVAALTVFDYANARLMAEGKRPLYDLHLVSPQAGQVRSDNVISLTAEGLHDCLPAHTALVVGARDISTAVHQQRVIVDWCRHAAGRVERLVGVCSGAFFLAQAGVLDGLEATTHWSVASQLAAAFPAVTVNADAIFIRNGRIWTCAGVSAALDLSLALVEQDLGQPLAMNIARELVVYLKRPGGQSQYSHHLDSQMTPNPGIQALQVWILSHLDQPLGLEVLARQANMSSRNLRRVFYKHTHSTPSAFIERARLELARRLLADGDTAIKRVASQCGFSSEQQMRRVFLRRLGVTPNAYRLGEGST